MAGRKTAFVTTSRAVRKGVAAKQATKTKAATSGARVGGKTAPTRTATRITNPQVRQELVGTLLSTVGGYVFARMLRAGTRLGMNLSLRASKAIPQATLRVLQKDLDKMLQEAPKDTVFDPGAHGPETNDAGGIATRSLCGSQMVGGRELLRYAAKKKIFAIYDTEMRAAAKMYKEFNVITDVLPVQWRSQFYFQSGFNCKGYLYPNATFPQLSAGDAYPTANLPRSTNLNGYPLAFTVMDYWNVMCQSCGELPLLSTDNKNNWSDTDMYYAIRSMKMEMELINSNAFYPCTVKIYVLRSIGFRSDTDSPVKLLLSTANPTTSYSSGINPLYKKYRTDATITNGLTGDDLESVSYVAEESVLPQVMPSMSTNFKERWKIVAVDTVTLNPMDAINYVLEKQIPHPTSFRYINKIRTQSVAVDKGDYAMMVEFQGATSLAVPQKCTTDTGQTINETVMGLAPTRLRVQVKKSAMVSAPAMNSTLNDVKAISTDRQTTWINQKNIATGIDTQQVTFAYSKLASTPGTDDTYTLPVYTDETKQYGGGLTS